MCLPIEATTKLANENNENAPPVYMCVDSKLWWHRQQYKNALMKNLFQLLNSFSFLEALYQKTPSYIAFILKLK